MQIIIYKQNSVYIIHFSIKSYIFFIILNMTIIFLEKYQLKTITMYPILFNYMVKYI